MKPFTILDAIVATLLIVVSFAVGFAYSERQAADKAAQQQKTFEAQRPRYELMNANLELAELLAWDGADTGVNKHYNLAREHLSRGREQLEGAKSNMDHLIDFGLIDARQARSFYEGHENYLRYLERVETYIAKTEKQSVARRKARAEAKLENLRNEKAN